MGEGVYITFFSTSWNIWLFNNTVQIDFNNIFHTMPSTYVQFSKQPACMVLQKIYHPEIKALIRLVTGMPETSLFSVSEADSLGGGMPK